jgi:hypothetical protein
MRIPLTYFVYGAFHPCLRESRILSRADSDKQHSVWVYRNIFAAHFPINTYCPFQFNVNKIPFVRGNFTGRFRAMFTESVAICEKYSFSPDIILFCLGCVQSDRNFLKAV